MNAIITNLPPAARCDGGNVDVTIKLLPMCYALDSSVCVVSAEAEDCPMSQPIWCLQSFTQVTGSTVVFGCTCAEMRDVVCNATWCSRLLATCFIPDLQAATWPRTCCRARRSGVCHGPFKARYMV
jgi:hypothetical protein